MQINIEELTIKQAKELAYLLQNFMGGDIENENNPFTMGENYLVRTVTHIDIGKLVRVTPTELVLVDVSWIADTGRYHDALKTGELNEVEPYPNGERVIIGRGALVDACIWRHDLPREQK